MMQKNLLALLGAALLIPSLSVHAAGTIASILSFNLGTQFADPTSLTVDAAGNIYGATGYGGTNNSGTIYEIDPITHASQVLVNMPVSKGSNPPSIVTSPLILDSSGNLYGTTFGGGTFNEGSIFEVNGQTHALTTLLSFNGSTGIDPASLIRDAAGNFYGTTTATVFKWSPGSTTVTTLATFNQTNGRQPGGLTMDSSGNIYGITSYGGTYDDGTVFKINAGSNSLTTLATFSGANGSIPTSTPILDNAGNIYGTTKLGGDSNLGEVYRLNAVDQQIVPLGYFNGVNGKYPSGLIRDENGNLFGTVYGGSDSLNGAVYKIQGNSLELTSVAFFGSPLLTGSAPVTSLVADQYGNLYGGTLFGGTADEGVVFEYSGSGFAVPEPASLALLGGATVLFTTRRRSSCRRS